MKKTVAGFLWVGVCLCSAQAALLEELAQAEQRVSTRADQVYQNDTQWQYFELKSKKHKEPQIEFNAAAYKNPAYLIVPDRRGTENQSGLLSVINGGQSKAIATLWSADHTLGKIPVKYAQSETLAIGVQRLSHHVWIGEYEVLEKLWHDVVEPNLTLYSTDWEPLLDRYNLSPIAKFNELKFMRGRDFATTPQASAKMYAADFATGLKAKALTLAQRAESWADAEAVRKLYQQDCALATLEIAVKNMNPQHMQLALDDLNSKFPGQIIAYDMDQLADEKIDVLKKIADGSEDAETAAKTFLATCRDMMLANPLLDNMELLALRRKVGSFNLHDHSLRLTGPVRPSKSGFGGEGRVLGIPSLATHTILTTLARSQIDWSCDIVKLSNLRGEVKTTPLFTAPEPGQLISNARLNWDGNRVAFTMGSKNDEMALYELDAETGGTKQLSPDTHDHFVDSCYLPDGKLITMSTAIMTSLPCEGGSHMLSNMYILDPETQQLRQIGVDQENSYHATVTADGKVMYIRYEYTDSSHYYTRIVMTMNPDGSNQREIYGSNSVWPTSLFYPQQIPGKPNLFSAVVAGHHGPSHMGKLTLFDVSKGRREAEGAVQFIGEKDTPIEAVMVDRLYGEDFPKYMYSVPLDAEYYLTMMKPSVYGAWGLYLIDRFDNKTLIRDWDEHFVAWPQVLKKKPLPPLIPQRVDENSKTSTLYVQDIYEGPGLAGIPRGAVKELAVYAFQYGYQRSASHRYIGMESGWDARYLLGTVPVNEDGSVLFNVPALMPISLSPLDAQGRALQKMRTWINPQPGEVLSCIGCHETADHAPLNKRTMASMMKPNEIKPWFGTARPYSYVMEVQPLLDQYCISCHNGKKEKLDLRNTYTKEDLLTSTHYSKSYTELQHYVRRNGPESDYKLMVPTEWHASSSTLVQMLKKGHHGVELNDDAWRKLYMWIDLNAPFHGSFHPPKYGVYGNPATWRADGLKKYAGLDWTPEADYLAMVETFSAQKPMIPVAPKPVPSIKKPVLNGWPLAKVSAGKTMSVEFGQSGREIMSYDHCRALRKKLQDKERIEFVRIPAGTYVMGDDDNYPNETPRVVTIKKAFWMSVAEITNSQLQTLDPTHDSRFADLPEKDQTSRGVALYTENQPAVRVSHVAAVAFCEALSQTTGKKVSLPTEEQWEWAARAGTDTDMWYGDRSAAYGKFANLSDKSHWYKDGFNRRKAPVYFKFDPRMDDTFSVTAPVKTYQPNAWGLYDMIGNAEEWTATQGGDGYIVRGGSWFDMPKNATSAVRWGYDENMRLPDLGFRVIIED